MRSPVPAVKVTDDEYLCGIRGPYCEVGPRNPIYGQGMSTEFLVQAEVAAFVEQVEIVPTEERDPIAERLGNSIRSARDHAHVEVHAFPCPEIRADFRLVDLSPDELILLDAVDAQLVASECDPRAGAK